MLSILCKLGFLPGQKFKRLSLQGCYSLFSLIFFYFSRKKKSSLNKKIFITLRKYCSPPRLCGFNFYKATTPKVEIFYDGLKGAHVGLIS